MKGRDGRDERLGGTEEMERGECEAERGEGEREDVMERGEIESEREESNICEFREFTSQISVDVVIVGVCG